MSKRGLSEEEEVGHIFFFLSIINHRLWSILLNTRTKKEVERTTDCCLYLSNIT